MREDAASAADRQAAANLALLRDFAFNILKTKNRSIKYATEIFANYHVIELLNILFRINSPATREGRVSEAGGGAV
jgi:hypothetical protein